MIVNYPFGQDPIDIIENTAAERVGSRIREIRESRGMTQAELGAMVGLNGDRVQKYESGIRKPKQELLKRFAAALGVTTISLIDPIISNHLSLMFAFFEMEDLYDLKVENNDGRLSLVFEDGILGEINSDLRDWEKKLRQVRTKMDVAESEEERAAIIKEYKDWKRAYPKGIVDEQERSIKELKRARIEEQIQLLKEELSKLDNDEE